MAKRNRDVAPDRLTARLEGHGRYHGSPCSRCGGTVRYTSNKQCLQCSLKKYALSKHGGKLTPVLREKVAPPSSRKTNSIAESQAEAVRLGYAFYYGRNCKRGHNIRYASCRACVECTLERTAKRRLEDPQYFLQKVKEYEKRNPDLVKAKSTRWRYANEDRVKEFSLRRKSAVAAMQGSHSDADALLVLRNQGHRCAYCGSDDDLSKDHKVPVSRGGSNDIGNIQWLCRSCNSKKGARTDGEYRKIAAIEKQSTEACYG